MRFDTHRIGAQLVNELQSGSPHLEVTYDGGDLIRVSLESSENVHIYLIENPITVYEIKGIIAANTAVGTYSLFILWCDLLLPEHGSRVPSKMGSPNDWMEALLALHGDKIYAFDAYFGEDLFIFPVYFEGYSAERSIRHGAAIEATHLFGETIATQSPYIAGVWRVANFEARGGLTAPAVTSALSRCYWRLGLPDDAEREAVKRAYRHLARKYHPDLNTDPAATTRMQAINEAYRLILEDLDERTPTHEE